MDAIREVLDRVVRQSYFCTKYYGILKLCLLGLMHVRQEHVLVYQMGKVGSTSITEALTRAGFDNVYQVHFLNPDNIRASELIYRARFHDKRRLDRHLLNSFYVRLLINNRRTWPRWKIVSLIREPVARNISAFFQNIDLEFDPLNQVCRAEGGPGPVAPIDCLVDLFLKEFQHHSTSRWFEAEIKTVFGIDVLDKAFDIARGYQFYQSNIADLLLIKYERLAEVFGDALSQFVGIPNVSMVRQNVGDTKSYSRAYRTFLETANLPESYLDAMYGSAVVKHFYSETEIASFRAKWSKPGLSHSLEYTCNG